MVLSWRRMPHPVFAGFLLGLMPAWRAKELMLIFFSVAETLAHRGTGIEILPGGVTEDREEIARERMEWHKRRGDTVVVVSASIDLWLKDWCEAQHVELIATKLEEKDGRISGRLLTKNCNGREKVRRIEERFDLSDFDHIYAYGDRPGDRPMLAIANERYYRWRRI